MSKIGQNSMKKWPFFAIILPWMASYGWETSCLLIFSARDDLVKVSWKSDPRKWETKSPPFFDWLSESTQPLSNYDLESLSRTWRMLTCCFWPLFGTTNIIGLFGGAAIFWPAGTTSTGPWFSPIWTEKMNYGDILKGECEMICFGARDKTNIVTTYFLFHWRMFFTHHFLKKKSNTLNVISDDSKL